MTAPDRGSVATVEVGSRGCTTARHHGEQPPYYTILIDAAECQTVRQTVRDKLPYLSSYKLVTLRSIQGSILPKK